MNCLGFSWIWVCMNSLGFGWIRVCMNSLGFGWIWLDLVELVTLSNLNRVHNSTQPFIFRLGIGS